MSIERLESDKAEILSFLKANPFVDRQHYLNEVHEIDQKIKKKKAGIAQNPANHYRQLLGSVDTKHPTVFAVGNKIRINLDKQSAAVLIEWLRKNFT
jgi:hypothetical protein